MAMLLLLVALSLPAASPQCGGLLCRDGRWLGGWEVCRCCPVGWVCCTDNPSSCAPQPQDCGVVGPLPSSPPPLPSPPLTP